MNNLVNDPLLRYASLAAAGLPPGDRHLASARTRRRVTSVTITLPLTTCTEDPDANRFPELDAEAGAGVTRGGKRKLVLIAY